MKNEIVGLNQKALLKLGSKAAAGATAIGTDIGLLANKAAKITFDTDAARAAMLAVQTALTDRVNKARLVTDCLEETRTWVFRAKDALKPHLGEHHNALYRATGFTDSLEVPRDFDELHPLVETLGGYFTKHPDQANDHASVQATPEKAGLVKDELKTANDALNEHDAEIVDSYRAQDAALEQLRARLRGLRGELEQLLGERDVRWRRFGFNVPAEPETPAAPTGLNVSSPGAGQLLAACEPVPFAVRYRWHAHPVGGTPAEPPSGSTTEPLFRFEGLTPGTRYEVTVAAVNEAGTDGPPSAVLVAEVHSDAVVA